MEGQRLNYLMRQDSEARKTSRWFSIWKNHASKACTDYEKEYMTSEARKCTRLKLLAIYDDDEAITRILGRSANPDSVQRLLSMPDERGRPCIFYALESRSKRALSCLLEYSDKTDCVVATNGESLLHVAANIGDLDAVKSLMAQDLVAGLVDHPEKENGKTPLHLAAELNHVEIAKELLLHGAQLDRKSRKGITPIFTAVSKGHASMLVVFLQHGGRSFEDLMFDSRLYLSHYKSLLHVAVDSGDEETVQVCLDRDPNIVCKCLREEIKHGPGFLIHSVCSFGMERCLLKIVDVMNDLEVMHLNRKDKLGFTPIHKAAKNNHAKVVKFLSSISRSFVNQTTEDSQTALVLAAHQGHTSVVEELLNVDADFRICDDSDRTVLHYGVWHPEMLRMLLKKKEVAKLLVNAKEIDGFTPMHIAAKKGLHESAKILLEHGADMNVFTNTSRSPLHCAVSSQCVNVVQLVLCSEPALINKVDATGKTPLHTAASYGTAEIVKCLLGNGALFLRDSNLSSALHIAAQKGNLAIVELLVSSNKDILDWKDKYGRTALIGAASSGKTNVVKYLLESNASITEDHEFLNCLDWCLIKNDQDTAMALMVHSRWKEILRTSRHGAEASMAKLVYKMPQVARRILCNSMTSRGHPDSKEHVKRYDFFCLQECSEGAQCKEFTRPMFAIDIMVKTQAHACLCHPVCRKFLKSKWMDFGWRVHTLSLLLYVVFLIALNIYAFQIPSYGKSLESPDYDASFDVHAAMVICLIFAGVNAVKELMQLIFYRHRYFLDPVNYLECVMYICVFIFAVPQDNKVAVKTSAQWKACSVALLLAWINLVLYLRRFASYGIYVLMMKKICGTLIKVLSLLIFFFVAFAAAFTVIMNDKQGFSNFGLSMLTSSIMTMGEFDFKETFLDEVNQQYVTFHWLRLVLLVAFVVLMPVILMNMILALAIGDTNSILQQAKLKKHIQTAKMIIELERKRMAFPFCRRPALVPVLEERPNKQVHVLRRAWEYFLYGPEFMSNDDGTQTLRETAKEEAKNTDKKFEMLVDMISEIKEQMVAMQQKMVAKYSGTDEKPCDRKMVHAWTQFREERVSCLDNAIDTINAGIPRKRSTSTQFSGNSTSFLPDVSRNDAVGIDADQVFLTEAQDLMDDKEREKSEHDPELVELKELHHELSLREDSCLDGEEQTDCKNEEAQQKFTSSSSSCVEALQGETRA